MGKVLKNIDRRIVYINIAIACLALVLIFGLNMLGDERHRITDTENIPDIVTCSFDNTIREEFTALSDRLDRVSVCLIGIDENTIGRLNTVIADSDGNIVTSKSVELNKLKSGEYYEEIVSVKLKKNSVYSISFYLEEVDEPQNIILALTGEAYQVFDTGLYINDQPVNGGILLVYDYLIPADMLSKIAAFILIVALSLLVSAVYISNKGTDRKTTKVEDTIISYITGHLSYIIIGISIILGVYVRWLFRRYESGDYTDFLSGWYEQIKELGGFKALATQIGNYGIPYQFLIALFSYLPIRSLYGYKVISCVFDFVNAAGIYKIVKLIMQESANKENKGKYSDILPGMAFAASVFFPTAIFNSACWAQCDAIYTSFIIWTIESIIAKKDIRAFVFYGISFAFKLQAIFFLPVLVLLYIKRRRFSIVNFIIVPVVAMLMCLPGYCYGRGLEAFFKIYISQAGEYPYLSVGYPSIWTFFADGTLHISEVAIIPFAIIITMIALGLLVAAKLVGDGDMEGVDFIRTSFMLTYTCVFFLPCMHERYSYLYATLAVILLFCDFHTLPQFSLLMVVELLIYGRMLFNKEPVFDQYAHILNIITYVSYLAYYVKREGKLRRKIA